jgi:hypothetical protein
MCDTPNLYLLQYEATAEFGATHSTLAAKNFTGSIFK